MNIEDVFKEYPKEKHLTKIVLSGGEIEILVFDSRISIGYHHPSHPSLDLSLCRARYKVIFYSNPPGQYYYKFIDGENYSTGKEAVLDHAKKHHPDFFEWAIWNLN